MRPRPSPRLDKLDPFAEVAQIDHFFVSYNEAKGKRFTVTRRRGSKSAIALIKRALQTRD